VLAITAASRVGDDRRARGHDCLLARLYRSRVALLTAIPATAGPRFTLCGPWLMHEPVNLFHVLSLLLVLGLGVDYAIILREGRKFKRCSPCSCR
jgi:predicted exporter